jgi:hypothetical protein
MKFQGSIFFAVLILSSLARANSPIQTGYCLYEQRGQQSILSYFSDQRGRDYFTHREVASVVSKGNFRGGTFEGTAASPGRPNCKLTTHVQNTTKIFNNRFLARIFMVDYCGRFVFDIPVTESAKCFLL